MLILLQRTLTVLAGNGISRMLLLAFEFIVAAQLGAASYGRFAVCLALFLIVTNLAQVGVNFGLVQFLSIAQEQGDTARGHRLIRIGLLFTLVCGLAAGLLVYLGAGWLASEVFRKPWLEDPFRVLALAIPFGTLNECLSAVFRGLRRFKLHVAVSQFILHAVLIIGLPAALVYHWSLEQLLLLLCGGAGAASLFGLAGLAREVPLFRGGGGHAAALKELLAFSWSLFVWNVFQKLAFRIQILLGGIFLDDPQTGVLGVLLRFASLFTFVQSGVNQVFPVEFARLNFKQDRAELKRLFGSVAQVLLIVSSLAGLVVLAKAEVPLGWVGAEFAPFGLLLVPIVCAQIVDTGTGPVGHLLISCEKQSAILAAAVAASAVQVGLSVLLMPRYGLAGAAATQTATLLTLPALRHAFSARLIGLHFFGPRFWVLFAAFAAGLAAALAAGRVVPGLAGWTAGAAAGLAVYLGLLAVYSRIDDSFRDAVRQAAARLHALRSTA